MLNDEIKAKTREQYAKNKLQSTISRVINCEHEAAKRNENYKKGKRKLTNAYLYTYESTNKFKYD